MDRESEYAWAVYAKFEKEGRHYENQVLYNALTGRFMWVWLNEKEGDILPFPGPLR